MSKAARGLDIKDILTGRRFHVLEQSASRTLHVGDVLFTRVATAGSGSIMIGARPWAIPASWHIPIIDMRERWRPKRLLTRHEMFDYNLEIRQTYHEIVDRLLHPTLPVMQNTDGDPIELTTLTDQLEVPSAIATLLSFASKNVMIRPRMLAVVVLCAAALHVRAGSDQGVTKVDARALARIPALMQEFVDRGTIAGAVTLVMHRGNVASLTAVGYRDLELKEPLQTNTIFQVRSMTKTVTAAAVLALCDDERLGLDDPVTKYLPAFQNTRQFTVRHLLSHTSGMIDEEVPAALVPALRRARTLDEVVSVYARVPLAFAPGTRYLYSGAGYKTLGRLIEVVSGKSYDAFVEDRLFRPLGMHDSSLIQKPDRLGRFAAVYQLGRSTLVRAQPYDVPAVRRLTFPQPSWSLFTTASDMAAFYQMLLEHGTYRGKRILSRTASEAMTTVQTGELIAEPNGRRADYGFGLNIIGARAAAAPSHLTGYLPRVISPGSYGHLGLLGTFGWVDPAKSMVGVFLIQRAPKNYEEAMSGPERDAFVTLAAEAVSKN